MLQKGLTWAPEAAKTPAGFVLYDTLRDAASGRQCISAAVADQPQGPFRNTRDRPLVCQQRLGGSIDLHRFVDRDGAAWEGDLIEAPTTWREGNRYYLLYSANDYGSTGYAVGYATASRVLGPYCDDPGNPILRSRSRAAGPGEQAVVRDADGDLWLAYHAWDSSAVGDEAGGQRSMWLDRLRFEGGRPKVDGPTDGPQEAP